MVFILRLSDFVLAKGAEVLLKQTSFFSRNTEFRSPQTDSTQSFLYYLKVRIARVP